MIKPKGELPPLPKGEQHIGQQPAGIPWQPVLIIAGVLIAIFIAYKLWEKNQPA